MTYTYISRPLTWPNFTLTSFRHYHIFLKTHISSENSHKKAKHKFFCQSSHMSKSSKKLPEFSCPNPDCPVGYHSFDTVKGYQNHLTYFLICTEYNSRLLSLQSLGKQPTQLMATVPLPREAVLDLKNPAAIMHPAL